MSSCSPRLSTAEMIAVLHRDFLEKMMPPGINDKGQPVYPLTGTIRSESVGCAVYRIASVNPALMKKLAEVGTHEACSAIDLKSKKDIDLSSIWDDTRISVATYRVIQERGRAVKGDQDLGYHVFLQDLQDAHDQAALAHHARKSSPDYVEHISLKLFRHDLQDRLFTIQQTYKITQREMVDAIYTVSPWEPEVAANPPQPLSTPLTH